jgi:hypothetical protein
MTHHLTLSPSMLTLFRPCVTLKRGMVASWILDTLVLQAWRRISYNSFCNLSPVTIPSSNVYFFPYQGRSVGLCRIQTGSIPVKWWVMSEDLAMGRCPKSPHTCASLLALTCQPSSKQLQVLTRMIVSVHRHVRLARHIMSIICVSWISDDLVLL